MMLAQVVVVLGSFFVPHGIHQVAVARSGAVEADQLERLQILGRHCPPMVLLSETPR